MKTFDGRPAAAAREVNAAHLSGRLSRLSTSTGGRAFVSTAVAPVATPALAASATGFATAAAAAQAHAHVTSTASPQQTPRPKRRRENMPASGRNASQDEQSCACRELRSHGCSLNEPRMASTPTFMRMRAQRRAFAKCVFVVLAVSWFKIPSTMRQPSSRNVHRQSCHSRRAKAHALMHRGHGAATTR